MLVLGAIAIIFVVAAIGIGALLLVRTRAPEGGYFNDSDRAAGVFGVLATGFAVLLGFIVFLAFASYDESRTGAQAEAQIVTQQYQTAQFLDQPAGGRLAAELVCYARYVVEREWPAMEDGNVHDAPNPWSVAMFQTLTTSDPQTSAEEAAFSKWLDETSDRQDARLDRVQGAAGIIPWPVWVVLIVSALIILGYMMFFADSGERAIVQALQVGTIVAVITATLLIIRLLENPYQSGVGVLEPTAMERTLRLIDQVSDIGQQAEPPCDENGDMVSG
jgi:hypothetical protein